MERRRSLASILGGNTEDEGGGVAKGGGKGGRGSRTPRPSSLEQDDTEGFILQKFANLNEELEYLREKVIGMGELLFESAHCCLT